MVRKFLPVFMAAIFIVCMILCGIFYVASQATIQLTPVRKPSGDVVVWTHAGENFLWTSDER